MLPGMSLLPRSFDSDQRPGNRPRTSAIAAAGLLATYSAR